MLRNINAMIQVEEIDIPPADFLRDYCEDAQFHSAFQKSKVPGFEIGYLLVKRDAERISVAPFFLYDYQLSLFFDNQLLKKLFGFLRLRAAFVGHPSADVGRIDGETSEEVLAAINNFLFTKSRLVVYKFFEQALPLHDFSTITGMPIPILKIEPDYFSSFHGTKRRHLKRELQLSEALHFKEVDHPASSADIPLDEIYRLYLNSYNNSDLQFEKLNRDYFANTLSISRYLLVYLNSELVGFAQWFHKNGHICGKYLGMDYRKGNGFLYPAIMLQIIKIAIRDGFSSIDFGVSGYAAKKRLGCQLVPTWVYFRHANPAVNWLLGRLKFLAEPSEDC